MTHKCEFCDAIVEVDSKTVNCPNCSFPLKKKRRKSKPQSQPTQPPKPAPQTASIDPETDDERGPVIGPTDVLPPSYYVSRSPESSLMYRLGQRLSELNISTSRVQCAVLLLVIAWQMMAKLIWAYEVHVGVQDEFKYPRYSERDQIRDKWEAKPNPYSLF